MPKNKQADINQKLEAIKRLLDLFKFERIVYIAITLLSLIILIGCAFYMIFKGGTNQLPAVISMFGSSGGIGFTCGRLLKMWSDAIKILESHDSDTNE
jgi:hypothetical protein